MKQISKTLSRKYGQLTDFHLIKEMQNGNLEIPLYLLYDKYKEPVLAKIGRVLFGARCKYTESDKEYWRDLIYIHLTEPRKRNEVEPYTTISECKVLFGWLMEIIQNFILTELERGVRNINIDDCHGYSVDYVDLDAHKTLLIHHLEFLNSLPDPKERYIIFSHILCSQHKQGTIATHFSERIAQILGLSPSNVRVILKRVRDKMRAELNKNKLNTSYEFKH